MYGYVYMFECECVSVCMYVYINESVRVYVCRVCVWLCSQEIEKT
jgi:hypothetical protein